MLKVDDDVSIFYAKSDKNIEIVLSTYYIEQIPQRRLINLSHYRCLFAPVLKSGS